MCRLQIDGLPDCQIARPFGAIDCAKRAVTFMCFDMRILPWLSLLGSLSTGPGKSLQFLRRLINAINIQMRIWLIGRQGKRETQQPKNTEKEAVQPCLPFDWFAYDVSENTEELVPCPEKCLDDPCPCSRLPAHWRLIETRVKAVKKTGQKSAIIINGTSYKLSTVGGVHCVYAIYGAFIIHSVRPLPKIDWQLWDVKQATQAENFLTLRHRHWHWKWRWQCGDLSGNASWRWTWGVGSWHC